MVHPVHSEPKIQFVSLTADNIEKDTLGQSSSAGFYDVELPKCPRPQNNSDDHKPPTPTPTPPTPISPTPPTRPDSDEAKIEQAVDRVMNDQNKLDHIFPENDAHDLDKLVDELGGQKPIIAEVVSEIVLNEKLPDGTYSTAFPKPPATNPPAIISVGSGKVVFEGKVVNGVPLIGTLYAKP